MTLVTRETAETSIRCELRPGTGIAHACTDQSFLDHMLVVFARYSGLDLDIEAKGDLQHHLVEDVAICIGAAVAGGPPAAAARYGGPPLPIGARLLHPAVGPRGGAFLRVPLSRSPCAHAMSAVSYTAR